MRIIFNIISKYLVFGIIGASVFLIFSKFASFQLNTADSSIYLSTAENIAEHKGFVVSYNLCQCFNTLYHSIWAYYQPLYPVFASFFIDHGGIVQVIYVNILIFALNAVLVFYIIQELMPTCFNLLFIVFLVLSSNFYLSSLYAWTEQLYFLCFLISFILFLKFKEHPWPLFWLGILNGILMLLRVAHLYNFMAYIPVLFIGKDPFRLKLNRAVFFAGGFILAYGSYQLFCLLSYHAFYPEYAQPGANYGHARFDKGIVYDLNKVGLQVSLGSMFTWQHLTYIGQHLRDFYRQMSIFILPAFFYYFLPNKKRLENGFIELCFFQAIFTILGYSLTFYWLTYSFDSVRYSMIPFVLISLAGWYCLYQGLSLSESVGKKVVGTIILLTLIFPQADKFIGFKENITKNRPWQRPYFRDLQEGYGWINKNLPKDILVASNEDQQGYFMHRPFISTPVGQSFNCANLVLFNRIYSPDYYFLSSFLPDKCFSAIAHTTVFFNKTFRLYKVIKAGK